MHFKQSQENQAKFKIILQKQFLSTLFAKKSKKNCAIGVHSQAVNVKKIKQNISPKLSSKNRDANLIEFYLFIGFPTLQCIQVLGFLEKETLNKNMSKQAENEFEYKSYIHFSEYLPKVMVVVKA